MLKGEKALPRADKNRDGVIKDYEIIVRTLRTVRSEFVSVLPLRVNPAATPVSSTPHSSGGSY